MEKPVPSILDRADTTMKTRKGLLFFLFVVAVCGSCVSFRIKSPVPGGNRIDRIEICANVEDDGDVLRPVEEKQEFPGTDASVYCFVKIQEITKKTSLRWRWYSPDKKLWRDTGDIIVNSEESYLEFLTAYDLLVAENEKLKQGEWTVIVLIDQHLAGKRKFTIK
jgi:hypothetical protein